MAEDQFLATREGRFRGSRYPGFVGGTVSPSTGLGTSNTTASGLSGGGNNTSLAAQAFDIPEYTAPSMGAMAKDLGGMAAGGATQWAATEVGKGAGTAIAKGASLGEGIKAGAEGLADTVSGWFSSGAAEGATQAGTEAGKAALQEGGKVVAQEGTNIASQSLASGGEAWSQTAKVATDGSTLGGAAGAGIGRAVVGLATGEKPAAALRAGAGASAGYYLGTVAGTAIGGPVGGAVGGFIGSTVGSIFCFAAGTLILMADGGTKPVESLGKGDVTLLGGEVIAAGWAYADEDLFHYKGEVVTGAHAVFEDGRWLRVESSTLAEPAAMDGRLVVYPVCTENRLLVTRNFIAADMTEVPNTWDFTEAQRIDLLNADEDRNSLLRDVAASLAVQDVAA